MSALTAMVQPSETCPRSWATAVLVLALLTAVSPPVCADLVGDFGDAADPAFPSRFSSNGPYHLDTTREWLGIGSTSTTTREADSLQTNADQDDNYAWLLPIHTGEDYFLATRISYDPTLSTKAETRYLNALLDIDRNGVWNDSLDHEWILKNWQVPLDVLPDGITTLGICAQLEPQNLLLGKDLAGATLRLTLSTEAVSLTDPLGAWGELQRGETEDILLASDLVTPQGWAGGGGLPGGGAKVQDILRNGGLEVKVDELLPWGTCPNCGQVGHRAPLCPVHADVRRWTVTVPRGTEAFSARWAEVGGCGNAWCADTDMTFTGPGPMSGNVTFINNWTPDLIVPPVDPLAAAADFTFLANGGLSVPGTHVTTRFEYEYVLDPDSEYWYVSGFTDHYDHTVPEPASLDLLLGGLLWLSLGRRRAVGEPGPQPGRAPRRQ